jgi:hypothetical protein
MTTHKEVEHAVCVSVGRWLSTASSKFGIFDKQTACSALKTLERKILI